MDDEQTLFSIGEVAAIVGLSRHTIRAWERRYGLRPRRTASGQRRYAAADIALLMHVKQTVARHRVSLRVAFGAAQGELSVPAAQEESPGLWRSAADLLPEVILILDVDGFITAANLPAAGLLGLDPEALTGRHLADLLERTSSRDEINRLLQLGCVRRTGFELEVLALSGRRRWALDCRPFSWDGQPLLAVIARPLAGDADASAV
jgi:PAS domain S-box-containing protein